MARRIDRRDRLRRRALVGEPEVAVRAGGDPAGAAFGAGRELGDSVSRRVDRPDRAVVPGSPNQRLPSVPTTMAAPGALPALRPLDTSLIAWVVGSIIPIAFVVPLSVNQMLPSGPATIPCCGELPAFRPLEYSLIACVVGLIVPIAGLVMLRSVNHRFPSGPRAIPAGVLPGLRPVANSMIAWVFGLIIPIAAVVPVSVNHRLPSGPDASEIGCIPVQTVGELGDRPVVVLGDPPGAIGEPKIAVRARPN